MAKRIIRNALFSLSLIIPGLSLAGPIGPPAGDSLSASQVILNQSSAQAGKTFAVSSATVSNIITSTVNVTTIRFGDSTTQTTKPPAQISVYPATATISAPYGITGSTLAFSSATLTGNVGIGAVPDPSAVFDASSTTRGILIPRLTTVQRDAINSPKTSLFIFNRSSGTFEFYNGSGWTALTTGTLTLGTTNGLSLSGTILSLSSGSAVRAGALTAADWSTFNGKLSPSGSGASLTGITATQVGLGNVQDVDQTDADNLASGTVGTARLGTGTANSAKYLRGDQTWQTLNSTAVGLGQVLNAAQVKQADYNQNGALIVGSGVGTYTALAPAPPGYFLTTSTTTLLVQWTPNPIGFGVYPATSTAFFTIGGFKASTATFTGLIQGTTLQFSEGVFSNDVQAGTVEADFLIADTALGAPLITNVSSITFVNGQTQNQPVAATVNGSVVANVVSTAAFSNAFTGAATGKSVAIGINSSSGTLQGNTFNGNTQLVQTSAGGAYPALSGTAITGIPQFISTNSWSATQTFSSATITNLNASTAAFSNVTISSEVALSLSVSTGTFALVQGSSMTSSSLSYGVGIGNRLTVSSATVNNTLTVSTLAVNGTSSFTGTATFGTISASSVTATNGSINTLVGNTATVAGTVQAATVTATTQINFPAGSGTQPGLCYVNGKTSGLFGSGSAPTETIALYSRGVNVLNSNSSGLFSNIPLQAADGSASAPSISFQSDPASGLYFGSASNFRATAGGVTIATFSSSGLTTSSDSVKSLLTVTGSIAFSSSTTATPVFTVGSSSVTIGSASMAAGVWGPVDGSTGTSGFVTQFISSDTSVSGGSSFATSGNFGDLVSIILPAGRYLLGDCIEADANGATVTSVQYGISTTSGNSATGLTVGINRFSVAVPISTNRSGNCITGYVVSSSSQQTYYLKYEAGYSVATPIANGNLWALRLGK